MDKKVSVHFADEAIGLWIELNGKTFPPETFLQKSWDNQYNKNHRQ
jgi:hypothetical protein